MKVISISRSKVLAVLFLASLNVVAQIGVGIDVPKAQLHVVKENDTPTMIIEGLKEVPIDFSHKNLFVDSKGEVVLALPTQTTSYVTNYKSAIASHIKSDESIQVIKFSDEKSPQLNNITTFIPSEEAFEVLQDGVYELSGFIGFNPYLTDKKGDMKATVIVVLSIQTKWKGAIKYEIATGTRVALMGMQVGIGNVIAVPATLVDLKAGDKVQMVVQTPSLYGSLLVGTAPANNGHINKPTGTKFTKSILIKKL